MKMYLKKPLQISMASQPTKHPPPLPYPPETGPYDQGLLTSGFP